MAEARRLLAFVVAGGLLVALAWVHEVAPLPLVDWLRASPWQHPLPGVPPDVGPWLLVGLGGGLVVHAEGGWRLVVGWLGLLMMVGALLHQDVTVLHAHAPAAGLDRFPVMVEGELVERQWVQTRVLARAWFQVPAELSSERALSQVTHGLVASEHGRSPLLASVWAIQSAGTSVLVCLRAALPLVALAALLPWRVRGVARRVLVGCLAWGPVVSLGLLVLVGLGGWEAPLDIGRAMLWQLATLLSLGLVAVAGGRW